MQPMMTQLLAAAAGGLLGSAHCIGMCGGFSAAVGLTRAPLRDVLVRQLTYHAGRVFTYAFLGAVAGAGGLWISSRGIWSDVVTPAFAILAGVVMLLVGLAAVGLPVFPQRWSQSAGAWFAPLFARVLNLRGRSGLFAAGLCNGLLPCGLVYAFVAVAAATRDPLSGALTMACFGAGTTPALVAIGCGSRLLTPLARRRLYRVAGAMMLVMGAVTVWRGTIAPAGGGCCHEDAGGHVAQRG